MSSLKFHLRHSQRGGHYPGSLIARLIHKRKVKVQTLPVSLYPHEWDAGGQCILYSVDDDARNSYLLDACEILDEYRTQYLAAVSRLGKSGRYSLSDILIGSQYHRSRDSLLGFTHHLSRVLTRSGRDRTARAYQTSSRSLVAFNKGKDLPLKELSSGLIREFESYLKARGKAMNTISYYMRMLRAIYRIAVREKLVEGKGNPFDGVFTGFEKTRKRALNIDELQSLNNPDFSELLRHRPVHVDLSGSRKQLFDCWRYFFFCFHARGMSFVDMAYLRKDNIRQGVISYYRKKTGQKIEVTLTPLLRSIIDSFSCENQYTPFVFPIIRDSDKPHRLQYENGLRLQNRRLKKLAVYSGLELRWGLTTHVTRHSWATTGKRQNLPLWVISEGLGHASEKMTYTYLASFDRSTIDKANERIARAIAIRHRPAGYKELNC